MTEKQKAFLDALFGDAKGDPYVARDLAGYSKNTTISEIIGPLADEIHERTRQVISSHGPKAAFAMVDVMDSPGQKGSPTKLAAAKDLLDRAGHKPKEEVEISGNSPVFYLPEKEANLAEEEQDPARQTKPSGSSED